MLAFVRLDAHSLTSADGQILDEDDLPIRMAAYGHCFRTEAGASGAATRGLYRLHQFSKVELFVICKPEQSEEVHQELLAMEEQMFRELGLHFRAMDMPSQDLGSPAYRKFDIEAWMPGLNRYGELSSATNCTDYQSRRLNLRYGSAPFYFWVQTEREKVVKAYITRCAQVPEKNIGGSRNEWRKR